MEPVGQYRIVLRCSDWDSQHQNRLSSGAV